jgi:hypothetical protein
MTDKERIINCLKELKDIFDAKDVVLKSTFPTKEREDLEIRIYKAKPLQEVMSD